MTKLYLAARNFMTDVDGQDLVEYALMVGMVTMTAGALLPQFVGPQISAIFSKIASCMGGASSFGS